MLLTDVLREFIFEIQIKNYSIRTQKSYKNSNVLFQNYIKEKYNILELEEINYLHIKEYVKFQHQKGRKPTYINSILKTLRSFFEYCTKESYINVNPCKKVSWQREGKVVIEAFNDSEVIKMLQAYNYSNYLNARNKTIMATLFDTGIRNLELCSLTRLDVRETIIRILGKGNKERYVSISPMLKKIMIKYERIRDFYFTDKIINDNNYFLSNNCRPLTVEAIERVVKIAGEKAEIRKEIRCSPHTARHYFAQAQLRNGLDVYSLSRLLGHENISITKRYLQSIQDEEILELSIKTSPLMNLKGKK
ncbi:MAG TPA: tyrosine-type recombinase/integrase [Clostridium sp.]|uniref:tyrosine-type recombinase/integrase n=1 Tax=Clostridium sp. TaxID=1506 RepID=UPI002F93EE1E